MALAMPQVAPGGGGWPKFPNMCIGGPWLNGNPNPGTPGAAPPWFWAPPRGVWLGLSPLRPRSRESRVERGPNWPLLSVCIRRLIAVEDISSVIKISNMIPTFGRNTGANLDIRFLHNQPGFDRATTTASIFGSEHPLAIGISQSIDRNDTDARGIVTARARPKSNPPAGLYRVS